MEKMTLTVSVLLILILIAGCNYNVVRNKDVKLDTPKCVCNERLKIEDPNIGTVFHNAIEKEFVRCGFELCRHNTATILISGSASLTERSTAGGSLNSEQTIESVSLTAKNKTGQILATVSYDNTKRLPTSRLAAELGRAIAKKLQK
jgi:hypothetical protein